MESPLVNEGEADVFLKFLCFLYDPMNVGNLISGSSAFSKDNLYICLSPKVKLTYNFMCSTGPI